MQGEFTALGIASDTFNGHLWLSKALIRSRQKNLYARVDLARKHARTKIRGRERSKDELAVLSFEANYDSVDARWAGLNAAFVQYSHGFNDLLGAMGDETDADNASVPPSRRGGNGNFASGEFDKIFLSLSRLQSLTPISQKLRHHSLLFRGELQWSDGLLVPIEQYAIGGPNNVRAYQPTEAVFDRAFFVSVEYIVNAPGFADKPSPFGNRTWGELVQVSAFYDVAAGRLNSPLASEEHAQNYNGVGFALSFTNPNIMSARLTLATQVNGPESDNQRDPQYWLDFNFYY